MAPIWFVSKNERLILLGALAICTAGCGSSSPEREPDAVDDAYRVCTAMTGTGLVSKCEVSGWNQSVDVWIDTNGREALQMCGMSASQVSQYTSRLTTGNWKLRIFSPFSGDNVLAECSF